MTPGTPAISKPPVTRLVATGRMRVKHMTMSCPCCSLRLWTGCYRERPSAPAGDSNARPEDDPALERLHRGSYRRDSVLPDVTGQYDNAGGDHLQGPEYFHHLLIISTARLSLADKFRAGHPALLCPALQGYPMASRDGLAGLVRRCRLRRCFWRCLMYCARSRTTVPTSNMTAIPADNAGISSVRGP
jgi:hypothetical protein